jgi:serine/threonine-protein kinase RsbT
VGTETVVEINTEYDILDARTRARQMATAAGFDNTEITLLATGISELVRNIIVYAGHGVISLRPVERDGRRGITVIASDDGPGIADLQLAMQDGYSTGGSLGLGLPGTQRLMDDFDVVSKVGQGTVVTTTKWTRH